MGRAKKPQNLHMAEWKTMHSLGAMMAKFQVQRGRTEKMDQGEFIHALGKAMQANPHLFPRGIPPAAEEMKRRDDGVIAKIEQPEKPGEE